MKKNYSLLFTNKITGILKSSIKSDRVFVQTTEKGIYVSEGHFAIKFSENDYRELVQPAVMRDPGNFTIDKTGIR